MYRRIDPFLLIFVLVACGHAPLSNSPASIEQSDPTPSVRSKALAKERIGERSACLLIADASGHFVVRTSDIRCAQPFRPFSTFKIPNSLIGLETGALHSAESVITWDPEVYPRQDWWPAVWTDRVHDLRSAFRYSHVPFYRTLARQIGFQELSSHVMKFDYGNKNITGDLDSFWLDGELRISADQQIVFLQRFYEERLGVSSHSTAVVKDILVRRRSGSAVLSAKTGTGVGPDGDVLAWLVGYVENPSSVHYFAFNITDDDADDVNPSWRIATIEAVLASEGIWPDSAL